MRKSYLNSKDFPGARGPKSAAPLKLAPAAPPARAAELLSKFSSRNVVAFPPQFAGNAARFYAWGLAASGRRMAEQRLDRFASLFGRTVDSFAWAEMTVAHVRAGRALLIEAGAKPSVINMILSHVRSVARTCLELELPEMSAETCAAIRQVEGVKGTSLPAGRALPQGEIDVLFTACRADGSPTGVRDLALLSVLYYGGLRRDEACGLGLSDYYTREHRLHVRGKNQKEEWVFLEVKAARLALGRWLRRRGAAPGPLFCSLRRGGRLRLAGADGGEHARPLTGDAVYKIVRRRAELAGLRPCTPHDLRRSAITNLLEGGADPLAVQEWARHEDVSTTRVYDRRRERAQRACARRLDPVRTRPRPRRRPHRPRRGRPRLPAPLETRPREELVALARVHRCVFGERASRAVLARLIREAVAEGID